MKARAYEFDAGLLRDHPHLSVWSEISQLAATRLVNRVWKAEAPPGVELVLAYTSAPESFAFNVEGGGAVIILSLHQLTRATALHELAHALVPRAKLDHGPAFMKKFIELLIKYGGDDPNEIMHIAYAAGVIRP